MRQRNLKSAVLIKTLNSIAVDVDQQFHKYKMDQLLDTIKKSTTVHENVLLSFSDETKDQNGYLFKYDLLSNWLDQNSEG